MDYVCTALAVLNKTQTKIRIQNRCLQYARRAEDSTSIFNNELRSRCNNVRVEQRIIALVGSWWKKDSNNNDDIVNFTYHHQPNSKTKTPLNIIKVISSSNPCITYTILQHCSNIGNYL